MRIGIACALFLLTACAPSPAPPPPPPPPAGIDVAALGALATDPARSAAAIEADAATYAWDVFVWLNSPLDSPDSKIWESWRETSTVYLPDGSRPPAWGQTPPPPELPELPELAGCGPVGEAFHNLDSTLQVDGLVLLDRWDQDVRYQLLMNEATFDYILERGFYNVNGQEAAAQANDPAHFPPTSWELKTSWIWIGLDEQRCAELAGKYYVAAAYYETFDSNGNSTGYTVGYAAFAGMHIINKSIPQWVWITFENVFNGQFTQVKLELPIPDDAKAANATYQQKLGAMGSILANYQLAGTQTRFVDPAGQPIRLANSTIESAFQSQSSCSTCHNLASISPSGKYFNMVDSSGGNVGYYVGEPPDIGAQGFVSLDFVWSLKRASRERTPASGL